MRQGRKALRRTTVRTEKSSSKLLMMMLLCLGMTFLTACQGGAKTLAESCWNSAKKESSLTKYIEKNWAALDKAGLQAEAENAENLSQQFKATALLCAVEQGDNGRTEDSPGAVSARAFLAKVITEEEEFWKALEDSFYPYDCFEAIFAVAGSMDGEVLTHLMKGIPAEAKYADGLRDAIDLWIQENPVSISVIGDELIAAGYFDDWSDQDWTQTYLYSYVEEDPVRAASVEEGLAYIRYLRDTMLPAMEEKLGEDDLKSTSDITGETVYNTRLAVVVKEELSLQEPVTEGLPETIETEGKKVIAFYANPASEEWQGSPAPLRILGDFMLNLPEEACPASAAEADYYLVLTPSYEYGSFYQDRTTGDETGIQEVWSNTSVDLYEAGTGHYLRHLGNVTEEASSSIVSRYGEEALEYPEITGSDILSYIYHNVNNPEAYISLVDQTGGKTEFERGESVILGSWDVTYQSCEIAQSLEDSLMHYEAAEGCQYIKADFTVTNVGFQDATFLPQVSIASSEDVSILICDGAFENIYSPAEMWTYSGRLNGSLLECGETEEGVLIFEVPEDVIQGGEGLYVVITRGYQIAVWPLGE